MYTGNLSTVGNINGITPTTLSYLDAISSIQAQLNTKLNLSGGTLTGNLNGITPTQLSYLNINISSDIQTQINTKLNLSGGTLTGNLNGITPTQLSYLNNISSDIQTQINTSNLKSGGTINGNIAIYGPNSYDNTASVSIINNSTQFGRTELHMVGRYEEGNDFWHLGGGRNKIIYQTQSAYNSAFTDRFSLQCMISSNNGNFGILSAGYSSTYPVVQWGYTGACSMVSSCTALSFTISSDRRLKENIEIFDNKASFDIILQLQHCEYNYIKDKTRKCIGFIAQDVQKFDPDCVIEIENTEHDENKQKCENFLAINYNNLFVHNIGATQHLYEMVQSQNKIIESLMSRIEILENKYLKY